MNILITPALKLTEEQKQALSLEHPIFFIDNELVPIHSLSVDFSLSDIDGIICNHFFTINSLSSLPNLKFIQLTSAGIDRVPLSEINKKGIRLFNAGSTYAVPISEWVVGQILAVYKNNDYFFQTQKQHIWKKNRSLKELAGSTAAIIGFGNIGQNVAKRLKAFDVIINAIDINTVNNQLYDHYYDISQVEDAVRDADIVIVCAPLNNETYHIIDKDFLLKMKENALLINPSRGALINEKALIEHIKTHPLFYAVLDVFEQEPLDKDSFFWDCPQVKVSPHNSFESPENKARLLRLIQRNVSSCIV